MGETIRCPYHGWQYDGDSGECTEDPLLRSHSQGRPREGRGPWSSAIG